MKRASAVDTPTPMIYRDLDWSAVALAFAGVMVPDSRRGLRPRGIALVLAQLTSFRRWLRENLWLGPSLQRVARAGGMPWSAKRAALNAMWTAVLPSSRVLVDVHWAIAVGVTELGLLARSRTAVGRTEGVRGWPVRAATSQTSTSPRKKWRRSSCATVERAPAQQRAGFETALLQRV